MQSRVVQHVVQRMTHFTRRLEHVRVIAVAEHGSDSTPQAVECTRDADAEALHAARERSLIVCFANEVQVIRQHGELDEPHSESIRASDESFAYGRILALVSQALQTVFNAQRDVRRVTRVQR